MKKIFVLGIILLFILLSLRDNNTYAYIDCKNTIIKPYEVTTLNLADYLLNSNYNEVSGFCSYNMCYEIRESNINKSINNFKLLYDKRLSENDRLEIMVKGYPITKIVVNNC